MTTPLIGVDVDDFHVAVKDALRLAADLEFRTVELATVRGDVAPENLGSSGRRYLLRLADGLGLSLAALAADMPGLRLTDPRTAEERVERTCRILQLAHELKVSVVTAAVGALTHPATGEPSPLAVEALQRIGEYADSRGVRYAIRPSYDTGERLVAVLEALRCQSVQVCLDPAAMIMTGANPLASIERLVEQVTLLHVRDGTAGLVNRAADETRPGRETRLGEGDVDLAGVVAALSAAEYAGPYILRRTDSQTPVDDLQAARDTLKPLLPNG